MTETEKKMVTFLTERRMKARFGKKRLKRLREKQPEAMSQYEDMYRQQEKATVKAMRPWLAEAWDEGWKARSNWDCLCWHKCTCKTENNPYKEA